MELGKTYLPQFSNERVQTYSVNGLLVRSLYIDFIGGGNDYAYDGTRVPFTVPHGEIWLDDQNRIEFGFIALHELRERYRMSQGTSYDDAHEDANTVERLARANPEITMDLIAFELLRQPRGNE